MNSNLLLKESKPHYEILDGLRGIAAIIVVLYHLLEIHPIGKLLVNHGYMAVDFFFMLSGFVIAYAYDDRWGKMTLKDFVKRRIIRLQPMIVFGAIFGAIAFYFQESEALGWASISSIGIGKMALVTLLGALLIPVGRGLDIRGLNEMYPLNGPAWSLFYEYIANLVYAVILRKVSNKILTCLMGFAAGLTIYYALTNVNGNMGDGWVIDDLEHVKAGFIRLAFPFLAGLLLARIGKLKPLKYAHIGATILLILALTAPNVGDFLNIKWVNGIYECLCIFIIFPVVLWLGACGKLEEGIISKICKFLGDISYPIYIIHIPIVYCYMAWVVNNEYTLAESYPGALLAIVSALVLAYASMKIYDIPVREWLRNRFL